MDTHTLSDIFRRKLKSKLDEFNWSQQDFADSLGVGKAYASHLLSGYRNPGLSTLAKVAEVLEVSPSWLISEK